MTRRKKAKLASAGAFFFKPHRTALVLPTFRFPSQQDDTLVDRCNINSLAIVVSFDFEKTRGGAGADGQASIGKCSEAPQASFEEDPPHAPHEAVQQTEPKRILGIAVFKRQR